MKSLFERPVADEVIARIERLSPAHEPLWGSMSVAQMLAHCSKPFDTVYDPAYAQNHPKPNALMRGLLRLLVKRIVVGEKPYKRNSRTAPEFVITDERDFDTEQKRLTDYIRRFLEDGANGFEGRDSHSFGPLTAREWNTMFYKHTDHHLQQFGV